MGWIDGAVIESKSTNRMKISRQFGIAIKSIQASTVKKGNEKLMVANIYAQAHPFHSRTCAQASAKHPIHSGPRKSTAKEHRLHCHTIWMRTLICAQRIPSAHTLSVPAAVSECTTLVQRCCRPHAISLSYSLRKEIDYTQAMPLNHSIKFLLNQRKFNEMPTPLTLHLAPLALLPSHLIHIALSLTHIRRMKAHTNCHFPAQFQIHALYHLIIIKMGNYY